MTVSAAPAAPDPGVPPAHIAGRDHRVGAITVSAAALGWGTAYPATLLVLGPLEPIGAAAWRGVFSTIAIVVLAAATRRLGSLRVAADQIGPLVVLGSIGGAIFTVCLNFAIVTAGASVAALGVGTFPVFMALSAPLLLAEPLRRPAVAAMVVAGIGVALVAAPSRQVGPAGLGLAVIAAITFATYLNLSRRWTRARGLQPEAVAASTMALTAVACAPVQAILDARGLALALSTAELAGFAWLALPSGALAQVAALSGVRRLPAALSAAFLFLVPLSGATVSVLLFGNRLTSIQVAGGALVVIAILTVTLPWRAVARQGAGWARASSGRPGSDQRPR